MDEKEKRDILKLYPEFNKVYGPYERLDGRKVVVFYNAEQKTSSRQFAKVKLEVKINRRLVKNETVDHIDENFRNDDLDNLQVLSNIDNAKKSSRASGRIVQIDQDQVCIICKTVFRSIRIYQTCGSPTCKARNRSAISKSLGLLPPQNKIKVLTEDQLMQIEQLKNIGHSDRSIAEITGVGRYMVSEYNK